MLVIDARLARAAERAASVAGGGYAETCRHNGYNDDRSLDHAHGSPSEERASAHLRWRDRRTAPPRWPRGPHRYETSEACLLQDQAHTYTSAPTPQRCTPTSGEADAGLADGVSYAGQRPAGSRSPPSRTRVRACTSRSSGTSATGSAPAPTTPPPRRTDTVPSSWGSRRLLRDRTLNACKRQAKSRKGERGETVQMSASFWAAR